MLMVTSSIVEVISEKIDNKRENLSLILLGLVRLHILFHCFFFHYSL